MQDFAVQHINNKLPELEQAAITIEAGGVGLKVTCQGKEYYFTSFQTMMTILDQLIVSAGHGAFEITTRFEQNIFESLKSQKPRVDPDTEVIKGAYERLLEQEAKGGLV